MIQILRVRLQTKVDTEHIIKSGIHVVKIDSTSSEKIPWTIKLRWSIKYQAFSLYSYLFAAQLSSSLVLVSRYTFQKSSTDACVNSDSRAMICLGFKSITGVAQVQDVRVSKVRVTIGPLQTWLIGKVGVWEYSIDAGEESIGKDDLKGCYATFYTEPQA